MKTPRIVLAHGGVYHCVSRIVDRNYRLGAAEKEVFRAMMRRLEAFLEVKVLTYCLMSNHFHLLVEVPDSDSIEQLTAASLRKRLPLLYRGDALTAVLDELDRAEINSSGETGSESWLREILDRYQARLGDLSVFNKELKARFSLWYNANNDRCGTLWESRFKSVLVEDGEQALMTIAAYIELNPVRAGIVDDPKDYRWCGYGEAMAGKKIARQNLSFLHARTRAWQQSGHRRNLSWKDFAATYRIHLFGQGIRRAGDPRTGSRKRHGIAADEVEKVIVSEGGELPIHQKLRGRVRYFCDGAAFGSAGFVDGVFEKFRDRFGKSRTSGARTMRGAKWDGLSTLRDLKTDLESTDS